jgi:hypothetical protein
MNITGRSLGKSVSILTICCGFVVFSTLVFAADASKEIGTAVEHAGFAIKAKNLKQTQLHLHHVVNCLVGSKGSGFDAAAGYPCKGQGNGAIKDASESKNEHVALRQALTLAKTGTKMSEYRPAHDVAMAVRDLLRSAAKDQAKQNIM